MIEGGLAIFCITRAINELPALRTYGTLGEFILKSSVQRLLIFCVLLFCFFRLQCFSFSLQQKSSNKETDKKVLGCFK